VQKLPKQGRDVVKICLYGVPAGHVVSGGSPPSLVPTTRQDCTILLETRRVWCTNWPDLIIASTWQREANLEDSLRNQN